MAVLRVCNGREVAASHRGSGARVELPRGMARPGHRFPGRGRWRAQGRGWVVKEGGSEKTVTILSSKRCWLPA